VIINTRVHSVAAGGENRSAEFHVLNALTPENEGSTHYFWGLVRNFAIDDDSVTETQLRLNRETFLEDLAILEQQQILLDCRAEGWHPLPTPNDAGCVQAERMMRRLCAAEEQSAASRRV
jgi:phenylpropionate dioxygenase-like ring-hydroxylating dioxygenase large terminal subunit